MNQEERRIMTQNFVTWENTGIILTSKEEMN